MITAVTREELLLGRKRRSIYGGFRKYRATVENAVALRLFPLGPGFYGASSLSRVE